MDWYYTIFDISFIIYEYHIITTIFNMWCFVLILYMVQLKHNETDELQKK